MVKSRRFAKIVSNGHLFVPEITWPINTRICLPALRIASDSAWKLRKANGSTFLASGEIAGVTAVKHWVEPWCRGNSIEPDEPGSCEKTAAERET